MLERLFRLSELRTTVRTEVLAGVTTFLTMAYIMFVQPAVLGAAGMDRGAVLAATCLASALATLLMALLANYPIAVAPAMGHNFFFAFTVVAAGGTPWPVALGAVAIAGRLFILTAGIGLRERVITAVPDSLKHAISVGIGLLIALIGLEWSGIVVDAPGTLVTLGRLTSPPVLLALGTLAVMAMLLARGVKGAMLIGMVASAIVAWATGLVKWAGVVGAPPSLAPTFLKLDVLGALRPGLIDVVLVFFLLALFDSVGTLIGVGSRIGLVQERHAAARAAGAARRRDRHGGRRRARHVHRHGVHRELDGRGGRRPLRPRERRHGGAVSARAVLLPARQDDRRRIPHGGQRRAVSDRRARARARRRDDDGERAPHAVGRRHGGDSGVSHARHDAARGQHHRRHRVRVHRRTRC